MDEMQSDLPNSTTTHVNGGKVKKKTKESETTDQHELTESSIEVTEEHHKHKKKNKKMELDCSQQTPTSKKKKRKLNAEDEVVVSEEAESVLNLHEVEDQKADAPESQELQSSSGQTLSKTKRKKRKTDVTLLEQEEQSVMTTEPEEVLNMGDQESGSSAVLAGTRTFKRKQTLLDELQVDPKLLNELKEFCPKIESKDSCSVNKMIIYDLPRFKEFRKQGVPLKHGKFSNAELERLKQNVRDFIALTGVKDANKLFHPKRFPEERQEVTKLKKNYRFFERIAEGIPRPCHDVFNRGRKLFDGTVKGRFTEDEIKSLLKYHTLHGSNWQKIAELTGRSASSLEKRFNHINAAKKCGPWSVKEEQRLLRAVRDHIVTVLKAKYPDKKRTKKVKREMLYQKLPWFNIAQKVKTRCWSKCREKWMSILTRRMSSGTSCNGRKAQEAKIRLIKAMYEMQVEDVADVDWDDLTAVFGDVPPAYVQSKWHQLKVCYVPLWKTKCFGDIVDFLYENILPSLLKDCEDFDGDELKVDQKDKFLLTDIFQDINEDNCSDSDEETGQKEDANST